MDATKAKSFLQLVSDGGEKFERQGITTMQINIGKLCNQACLHCHVEAGPNKTRENMQRDVVDRLKELAASCTTLKTVDITGGAPELNPHFRDLVCFFRSQGLEVIDRCNLTVLFEKGQETTAEFLAEQQVHVIASLPCYSKENVEAQRGEGVFEASIAGLRKLNSLGYGQEGSELKLDLVYNPIGASLPPAQQKLEADYKVFLAEEFGISFNSLFTITNMPIKRFLFDLKRQKKYAEYMDLLRDSYNPAAVSEVMCRQTVSISWDGYMYDCDFNQMLNLNLAGGERRSIFSLQNLNELVGEAIATASHCFGCTAGAGSSCTGSIA